MIAKIQGAYFPVAEEYVNVFNLIFLFTRFQVFILFQAGLIKHVCV